MDANYKHTRGAPLNRNRVTETRTVRMRINKHGRHRLRRCHAGWRGWRHLPCKIYTGGWYRVLQALTEIVVTV
ncbi:hypothetical protein J6590_032991 [Homalodisca vitripennis]|nr:hypothetical protein J6590_032991 [Homalodisca vitripennis]